MNLSFFIGYCQSNGRGSNPTIIAFQPHGHQSHHKQSDAPQFSCFRFFSSSPNHIVDAGHSNNQTHSHKEPASR